MIFNKFQHHYSRLVPFILAISLALVAQAHGQDSKVKLVASIFPAYDLAREIGGDHVELKQLLPPGVEAHGFSPTPRDIVALNRADLLLYTGSIMEPRLAKMLRSIDGDVRVIDLSSGIMLGAGGRHNHHEHHGLDPHFWLDPQKVKIMVATITQALVAIDPNHGEDYQGRAAAYVLKLDRLDAEIRQGLGHCEQRTIISGGHFAFGHFIKRYNLQAVSAYPGFSPDGKPSPKSIATLIQTMQDLGATTVYHEELMDPKVARIIVEETGANLLLLHGIHNVSKDEMAGKVTYLSLMHDNLSRLRLGLSCQ